MGDHRDKWKIYSNGSVYFLRDPSTGKIFYVGVTSKPLNTRLSLHLVSARKGVLTNVGRYISKMQVRPEIVELESFSNESPHTFCHSCQRLNLESFWITQLKAWGFELENTHIPTEYYRPFTYVENQRINLGFFP